MQANAYSTLMVDSPKESALPKLKLKVEDALHKYLIDETTDEEFQEKIQSILEEFEGKNLLHQNIGQLTWKYEKENPDKMSKFKRIWALLDQVSPQIREDLNNRMKRSNLHKP
jgi:hypothetical protein